MFDAAERKNLDEKHLSPAAPTPLFPTTETLLFPANHKGKKPSQKSTSLQLKKHQVMLRN
jgi:hypothetical protein